MFFPRQYDKVHEKREEIVERIKNFNREATQYKATIQKLRDTCTHNTEKAQVHSSTSVDVFNGLRTQCKVLIYF